MSTPGSERHAVALVNPPSREQYWYKMEHLGIGYLASTLRQAGIETRLFDAHLSDTLMSELVAEISRLSPLVVGLTSSGPASFESAAEVAHACKQVGVAHVTIGGYYPTFNSERVLARCTAIDSVVRGEGEAVVTALVEAVRRGDESWRTLPGVVSRSECGFEAVPPGPQPDLQQLPPPARDTLPDLIRRAQPVSIIASRGCAHDCSFCQIHEFYRLAPGPIRRLREPSQVVDEIAQIVDEGVRTLFFVDDEFVNRSVSSRAHMRAILEGIIARSLEIRFAFQCRCDAIEDDELLDLLVEAGAFMTFLGVESCVQRTLDSFNKRAVLGDTLNALHALELRRIVIDPGYIMWDFDTTWNELKESISFLEATPGLVPLHLHGLEPLPGTRTERELRAADRLVDGPHGAFSYVSDPQVELFARLINEYSASPIYTGCVQRAHALLFGDFDPRMRGASEWFAHESSRCLSEIRRLHMLYVEQLCEAIEARDLTVMPEINRKVAVEFERERARLEGVLADNEFVRKVAM